MPTPAPLASDPWRDAEGNPLPLRDIPLHDAEGTRIYLSSQVRVEQVAVDEAHGALPSRLHRQGEVIGRGRDRLYVRFDLEYQLVILRPHLVRVLTTPDGL
jgi:hypothetical protein